MESVKKTLCLLKDLTDALSSEDYVSVSSKPVLYLLKVNILSLNEVTKTMKTTNLDYLTATYQDPITDDLLDMASLVDPRFKTQYIDGDKIEEIQAKVVSEMECLLTKQYPAASDQQPTSTARALMQNKHHPRKQRNHLLAFCKPQVL